MASRHKAGKLFVNGKAGNMPVINKDKEGNAVLPAIKINFFFFTVPIIQF
jgi:hypothetical protein